MRLRNITMAGIILLMLALVISPVNAVTSATTDRANTDSATTDINSGYAVTAGAGTVQVVDDIEPDESIIGPENALYRLKLAFEDLDIAFTFNESEKIGKQVSQAQHRLAELKTALKKNNLKAADVAIEQYREETQKAEESISRLKKMDRGLVRAQASIANHSYVLERLIESHPNNTGLLRAFNNSERLIEKFTLKTNVRFERWTEKNGRKMLRHVDINDDGYGEYEKTGIKAEVENNRTKVKVELRFFTNSTESVNIAGDILDRIDAVESNVSGIIKIEHDDEADQAGENEEDGDNNDWQRDIGQKDGDDAEPSVTGGPTTTLTTSTGIRTITPPREKLKADAEVKGNTTRVKFEYTFFLNVTDDAAIISGVQEKLSILTVDKILRALDVKVIEKRVEIEKTKEDDRRKVEISEKKRENNSPRIDRVRINEPEDKYQDR